MSPKTKYEYSLLLKNRIVPVLGHIPLTKIQPMHIIDFYNDLMENGVRLDCKYKIKDVYVSALKEDRKNIKSIHHSTIASVLKGNVTTKETAAKISSHFDLSINKMFEPELKENKLSDNSIAHHHRALSTVLTTAVYWQMINSNPCKRVKAPKVEQKEAKYYDEKQVADMFLLLEEEDIRCKLGIYIVIFSGVRLGELSALEWKDIDFKNGIVKINKARQYVPQVGTFEKTPKTNAGDRIVSIPPILITLLKQYKKIQFEERQKCGDLWVNSDKIFTQWDGTPLFPSTPSKWFADFIKKAGLEKITFHQLRHTNASLLIAEGVDVVTVSKRLGHSKTSTTTDIYSHSLKKADQVAAGKLQELFSSK